MKAQLMLLAVISASFQTSAFLIAQESAKPSGGKTVLLTITLPAEAKLEIEGTAVAEKGSTRRFQSPPLAAGKEFQYRLKATWQEKEKPRSVAKTITVRAGESHQIDLHPANELTPDENGVLELVNQERARAGAKPLKENAKLTRAARSHSANMARQQRLDHTLDGKTFSDRIDAAGYRSGEAGENCAKSAETPADVVQMWMNSPGHRANILNPNYREIGLGIGATSAGEKYWTLVFAVPAGE